MEHPVPYQPQQQQHHPQAYDYEYNRPPPTKHRPRDEDGPMHPPPFPPYSAQPEHDRDSAAGDESDSDDTLSFQTLNADGTPKRPMNAFLLYAKKRRPQISTSHPTMRTGEISKVLSKEWQGMNKGEKQYYQDKAKKLKDTFNVRWPDYVYKRRPNNSRKKRRGNPNPDSPVIDEAVPAEGEPGVEPVPAGFGGEEPNPEEAEGSPDAATRLPHDRPNQDDRIAAGTYTAPPQGDPRSQPQHRASGLADPGPAINPRLGYPPSSAAPPNYPPYEEPYSYPSYYSQPGQPQGPSPRLPPVWAHEGGRPPYDGDRSSSSATSAPAYPNGGPDDGHWAARPGGSTSNNTNGNSMNPSWSSLVHPQNSHAGQMPRTLSRNHSLSSQSPIPSPTDNSYPVRRPRNWPQHSPTIPDATLAGRPNFNTLTSPLYPPPNNNHHPHTIRGTSPSSYYSGSGGGYGYPGPGPSGQIPSGRSPLLPALNSLEQSHSYQSQPQGPTHLRHEPGYHHPTPLPPIMGSGNTHTPPPSGTPPSYSSPPRHAQGPDDSQQNQHDQHRSSLSQSHSVPVGAHSFSESRSSSSNSEHPHPVAEKVRNTSSGIASGDSNTLPLPVGLGLRPTEFSTSTHHNSYWDPVKSEAGE